MASQSTDLLPDSPRGRKGGGTELSRGLSSAGGSSRHVTLLGGLRLPPLPLLGSPAPSPLAHPGAAVMDRLGSGIPLDPTTGTRSAGATEFVLGGEGRGQSWGGGNHLPSPRREAGRRGAREWGVVGGRGGRKSRGSRGARCVRAAPHPSPHPLPVGRGGLGGGASRWRRGGRQSRTPLLPPPPPPPLPSPLVLQALVT